MRGVSRLRRMPQARIGVRSAGLQPRIDQVRDEGRFFRGRWGGARPTDCRTIVPSDHNAPGGPRDCAPGCDFGARPRCQWCSRPGRALWAECQHSLRGRADQRRVARRMLPISPIAGRYIIEGSRCPSNLPARAGKSLSQRPPGCRRILQTSSAPGGRIRELHGNAVT